MYISAMFITYVAASFLALIGIGLVLLLITRVENRHSHKYRIAMCFALVVFAQCTLYLYFYYCDMVLLKDSVNVILRVIDYALCAGVFFFLLQLIRSMDDGSISEPLHANKKRGKLLNIWSYVLGILIGVPGIIGTVFFMDDYYSFTGTTAGNIYLLIEIFTVTLTVIVVAKYAFDFFRDSPVRAKRIYIAVVTITLLMWDMQQIFVDSGLYIGAYKSAWQNNIIDTTGIAMAIVSCATFVYMFKEDFSPLYYVKPVPHGSIDTTTDRVGELAEKHMLTVRETDVLRQVYEGKNNPDIAAELFISVNTVKKHMKNIFEKTGVSSRMELLFIINETNK